MKRVTFTRRELRERLAWGDTQLKVHLSRLVSLELVHAHRGAHGQFVYELAWDRDQAVDGSLLPGLIDPDQPDSEHGYDTDRSGPESDRSGDGRALVGARSGSGRPAENGADPSNGGRSRCPPADIASNHGSGASSPAAAPVTVTAAAMEMVG